MSLEPNEYKVLKQMPWMPYMALLHNANITTTELKEIKHRSIDSNTLYEFITDAAAITNTFIQRMIAKED